MSDVALAALLAAAVFVLPVVVLSPVIDRFLSPFIQGLFDNGQLRAMVRRIFRIDAGATLVDFAEPRRLEDQRPLPP